jgi:hypothetical protein
VVPAKVEPLLNKVWDHGKLLINETLQEKQQNLQKDLDRMNQSVLDLKEPTVYPVLLSTKLYETLQKEFAAVQKLANQ